MNACSGLATIAHSAHDKIRTANKITTGKHPRDAGHLIFVSDYAAPFVDLDLVGIAGGKDRDRIEAVGNQHDIDWQTEFGARNWARFATSFRIGFTQFHSDTARFANFASAVV